MIFIKIFRAFLYDPRLRNLPVNDPKLLAIHSKILHEKKQLKKVFNDFYDAMLRCNKKFITCCNQFNNAVNFRGEPLIPEYNFLKAG